MRTSESIANLVPALVSMKSELGLINKSGENKYDKYTYANLEDYVLGTNDILIAHKFFLTNSIEKVETLPDRTTKNGGIEHAVQVTILARLIHESGEWLEIQCSGEGQDRADKAIYKAITGARKYAIASILGLATSDDPEADEQVGLTPGHKPKPTIQNLEGAVIDWIAKIQEQNDAFGLRKVYEEAVKNLTGRASEQQLGQLVKAKDERKAILGLHAQNGVSAQ